MSKIEKKVALFLIAMLIFPKQKSNSLSSIISHLSLEKAIQRPIFSIVNATEAMNGSSMAKEIEFSIKVSEVLGLKKIAGSDAHSPRSLGNCVTIFSRRFHNQSDFLEILNNGDYGVEDWRGSG